MVWLGKSAVLARAGQLLAFTSNAKSLALGAWKHNFAAAIWKHNFAKRPSYGSRYTNAIIGPWFNVSNLPILPVWATNV